MQNNGLYIMLPKLITKVLVKFFWRKFWVLKAPNSLANIHMKIQERRVISKNGIVNAKIYIKKVALFVMFSKPL